MFVFSAILINPARSHKFGCFRPGPTLSMPEFNLYLNRLMLKDILSVRSEQNIFIIYS